MEVRGTGPTPCDWFICGKGPGQDEDRKGEPFVGKTGEEMRRHFDGDALPPLAETFRTNIYRVYGGKDYDYSDEDFARDEPKLLDELRRCQPKVIVAVGADATKYFLGKDVTLDETHGLPWKTRVCKRDVVVFATYHPAAGFRSPEASALVTYDFGQLAAFASGELKPRTLYDDPIPHPQYRLLKGKADVCRVLAKL